MNCTVSPKPRNGGARVETRARAVRGVLSRRWRLRGEDVDHRLVLGALLVRHLARDDGVDGVVAPHLDAAARVDLGADLADEDVSGDHALSPEDLDAAVLAGRAGPVAGGALPFFVCHGL